MCVLNMSISKVTPVGKEMMRAAGFDLGNGCNLPSTKALATVLGYRERKAKAGERSARAEERQASREWGATHEWPAWKPKARAGSVSNERTRLLRGCE